MPDIRCQPVGGDAGIAPFLEEVAERAALRPGADRERRPAGGHTLELLVEVDEVCALPDGHPLLAREAIELRDFEGQAFVSLSASDPSLADRRGFRGRGRGAAPIVETPSAVSVCAFVRQGLGVAIVNPLTALDFIGNGLQARPLTRSFPFRVNAVYPEHRPKSPLVDAFAAAVREQAREMAGRLVAGQARRPSDLKPP